MAVTPTGFLSLVPANLEESLSQSSTFQTFVGHTGNATAAKAHIYWIGMTASEIGAAERPYAVISVGEIELSKIAGGAQWNYQASGAPGFLLYADVNTAASIKDQFVTMLNALGAIVKEMAANTGPMGYYSFDRAHLSVRLTNEDEHADEPEAIEASCLFPYDGSPIE